MGGRPSLAKERKKAVVGDTVSWDIQRTQQDTDVVALGAQRCLSFELNGEDGRRPWEHEHKGNDTTVRGVLPHIHHFK